MLWKPFWIKFRKVKSLKFSDNFPQSVIQKLHEIGINLPVTLVRII